MIISSLLISLVACGIKKLKKIDLEKIEIASISANYESIKLLKVYNAGTSKGESEMRANVYLVKIHSDEEQLFVIEPCRDFPQLASRELQELEKRDLVLMKIPPLTDKSLYIPEDVDIPAGSKVILGSLKLLSY